MIGTVTFGITGNHMVTLLTTIQSSQKFFRYNIVFCTYLKFSMGISTECSQIIHVICVQENGFGAVTIRQGGSRHRRISRLSGRYTSMF